MSYVGKQLPEIQFQVRELNAETGEYDWTYPTTSDYFLGRRVVVFSLPGAFTPTCSEQQVPGFDVLYDQIIDKGIDEVYCMSVNDSFVMNAWSRELSCSNVKMIPDGGAFFTQEMDMLVVKDNLGFGRRSWRYAMVVNNGVVEALFVEPGKQDDCLTDPYGASSPEVVLEYLTNRAAAA